MIRKTAKGMKSYSKGSLLLLTGILLLGVITGMTGCSDGGTAEVQTGTFVDSIVAGLEYKTGTQKGITDNKGRFKFRKGETITFFVGGIVFGEPVVASEVMTPVDLVPGAADEKNPTVTNICRILHTLDDDHNAENGIVIVEAVRTAAIDLTLDFTLSILAFGMDTSVLQAVDILTPHTKKGKRPLALAISVQTHLSITLLIVNNMVEDTDNDDDGFTVAQGDCNDEDAAINPGAEEVCGDGIDQDCDGADLICISTLCEGTWTGTTDQGYDITFTITGDAVTDIETTLDYTDQYDENCVGTNTLSTGDLALGIEANAFSLITDELKLTAAFTDGKTVSGDWFYQNAICGGAGAGTWTAICGSPDDSDEDGDGFTIEEGDCDDTDATINPKAVEICGDGIDQDCNGSDLICIDDDDDSSKKDDDSSKKDDDSSKKDDDSSKKDDDSSKKDVTT